VKSRDSLGRGEEGLVGLFGFCCLGLFPPELCWGEVAQSMPNADKSKKAGGGCPEDVGISGADQK
jgi:hypothetical protein